MNNRKRGFLFGRRRGMFSATPKKPVSMTTKVVYGVSLCSVMALLGVFYYVVTTGEEANWIMGGIGIFCLYIGLLATLASISKVRKDIEPLSARVLSIIASLTAFLGWGGVYLIGMVRG